MELVIIISSTLQDVFRTITLGTKVHSLGYSHQTLLRITYCKLRLFVLISLCFTIFHITTSPTKHHLYNSQYLKTHVQYHDYNRSPQLYLISKPKMQHVMHSTIM